MVSAAPKSLQATYEAISLQKDDLFMFFDDFSPTQEKTLLMSSAAPISLQDSDASDRGDFAGEVVDGGTEDLELYALGLYYPICIADVLIHTYRIEHKLGHDDFSTAWLAHDIKKKRDVTLIMIFGDTGDYECSMQKEIMSTVQDTSNLVTYLTTFSLPGCKGNHQVLVFPVRARTSALLC
jgi:hypothetical protein